MQLAILSMATSSHNILLIFSLFNYQINLNLKQIILADYMPIQ